jgi:hypothetical protein
MEQYMKVNGMMKVFIAGNVLNNHNYNKKGKGSIL